MKSLLITDASVLVNLLATEAFEDIARQSNWRLVICEAVQREVLALRNAETGEMEPIDLQRFVQSQLLEVVSLEASETAAYVEYSALVDDGEAMSLAIAEGRQLAIAIDDRKALNIARDRGQLVTMLTTPDLLHAWSQQTRADDTATGALLKLIETRARYLPPKNHALKQWWNACRAAAPA